MLSSPAYVAAGVRTTWTLCGGGRLCAWAAQATGEVERSEGEGRGAAPPGVGLGDMPASWCACSWSFGSHVGNTVPRLYCWMVWWRRSVRETSRGGATRGLPALRLSLCFR